MNTAQRQKLAKRERQKEKAVERAKHYRQYRINQLEKEDSPLARWQLAQLKREIAREKLDDPFQRAFL